jgi:hypothetical protein
MRDTFKSGRNRSTFDCTICGHRTRDTYNSEGTDLCPDCNELTGSDNYFNDTSETPGAEEMVHFNALLAKIAKKGANAAAAKDACRYIWPKGNVGQRTTCPDCGEPCRGFHNCGY